MIGRRQPCPCGSGKQYRKCCGKKMKKNQSSNRQQQLLDFDSMNFIRQQNVAMPSQKKKRSVSKQKPVSSESVKVNEKNFRLVDGTLHFIGKDRFVKVPESIHGKAIKKIGEDAFAGSNVEVVFLPEGIEEIEDKAFEYCTHLRQINFPEGLKRIGRWSFQGCYFLQKVVLPESLETLDGYAFDECHNLSEVKLPSKMQGIGAYAFSETNLQYIKVPEGIEHLGNSLFYACTNLEFVEMPEGIKEISNMAFAECHSLDNVFLPKSLKKIGEQAFQNCINLATMTIRDGIEKIAEYAFSGCNHLSNVISIVDKDYKVEILDTNYEMFIAIGMIMTQEEYEKEYNTKFRRMPIGKLISKDTSINHLNKFWTCTTIEKLHQFEQNKKNELYSSLNIKPEDLPIHSCDKIEETIYVEGLSNSVEEELTEKDLYVETLVDGHTLKRKGDIEGAIAKYKEAIEFKPLVCTAYYNLGKALYIRKDYEASVRSYKMAIQLGQDEYEVLRHIGHSLLDQKMKQTAYKDVIQQYEEGINPSLMAERMLSGNSAFYNKVSKERMDEYDQICISEAEKFLQQDLEDKQ